MLTIRLFFHVACVVKKFTNNAGWPCWGCQETVWDIDKLINPFQLPGFHYFCRECEKTTIPDFEKESHTSTTDKTNVSESSNVPCKESGSAVISQCHDRDCAVNGVVPNVLDCSSPSLDVDDSKQKPSSKVTSDKLKTKICIHYKRNQCKHGLKGKHCPFLHPERCQKLMQNGTKSPDGCNLGKNVLYFIQKCVPHLSRREFVSMRSVHCHT